MLASIIVGFILCCEEPTIKSAEEAFVKPHEKAIDDGQDDFLPYAFVDSVQVLTEVNREALPFNGRFFLSVSWNDKLGGNTFIFSEKGKYDEGNGRKEIFAYHYVKRDTSYGLLWKMNDFVDGWGCDLDIQLINFFPFISDVDSNGIAEIAIFYSLNNRCDAVSLPAKLIVHEGKDKFAIRGIRDQYLNPPEEINNKYRANDGLPPLKYKNLDTAYARLDTSIIHFYTHQWDSFIALENTLQGDLPESLITIIN